ncbi:MAG: hypothetical protein GTN70_04110 [Deltaproteobacteria bacterium]|nr:hypothetical protein [Deltaproteobacteria bacterium]NIS76856.1 hypothetical protein [Deltaproteobacteria bacterium]
MAGRWSTAVALVVVSLLVFPHFPSPSLADDVEDTIGEAQKLYKSGDYNETIRELEFAIQLVRRKKSERLKAVFPGALPGWEEKEVDITGASSAYLGGGIQASREYTKGGAKVVIDVFMDNPFLQGIFAVVDNPLLFSPESEPVRVGGNRANLFYDPATREGELKLVFRKKVLISVRGYRIGSADLLKEYAGGINFGYLQEIMER